MFDDEHCYQCDRFERDVDRLEREIDEWQRDARALAEERDALISQLAERRGDEVYGAACEAMGKELERLAEVFDAACAWRDERCSRLTGCDPYDGTHDDACDVTTNMRRLCAAVDKARGA